jgi:hypothetical protein
MAEKFRWRGELIFEGTAKEFNELSEALSDFDKVAVSYPHGWPPIPFPGYPPWPWFKRLPENVLNKLMEDGERVHIKWLRDICGGIRDPHMHVENDVVMLSRDKFKLMVKEVASILAEERVDRAREFASVMDGIKVLSATPIEIP